MRSSFGVGAFVLSIIVTLSVACSAQGAAGLTPLGDLPGGQFFSEGNDISGDGSVAVGRSRNSEGEAAFRWTSGGGIASLGDLAGGGTFSTATAVNGDGSVVVGVGVSDGGNEAFRWTSGTGMVGLGAPAGDFDTVAEGVSADGNVIAGAIVEGDEVAFEAFRWTSGTGFVGLGDLPGGAASSYAFGISRDGSSLVGQGTSASGFEAFRWRAAGGMIGLGDLPGGGFQSIALDANADGEVIVGQGYSANGLEAFRWTSAEGMKGLGDLPGGSFGSQAAAVSDNGIYIVGNSFGATNTEAFIWDPGYGMRRLWDVLLSAGVNPAADGWSVLNTANGISADGVTISGTGIRNGNTEAFVAVVPEPGTVSLLALVGGAALLLPRKLSRATSRAQ